MRISVLLAITTMGLAPALLSAQQWTLEGDVALRSRYEWRGLALDPGHNLKYSAYASVAWDAASVTFGVWSLADLSTNPSAGLPERWGFETSPWLDATLGDDRRQLVVGITGYDIGAPSGPEPLRRSDTWEIYAGGRGALPGAPVVGEAVVYWDMGRVGGAYAEVAGALQIPVWAGLIVPVGSIFLEGRTGFALRQERGAGETDPRDFHFEGGGLTHLDVSLRTTLLPVPPGSGHGLTDPGVALGHRLRPGDRARRGDNRRRDGPEAVVVGAGPSPRVPPVSSRQRAVQGPMTWSICGLLSSIRGLLVTP